MSVVVNYEEGSEATPYYGDKIHETIGEMESGRPPEVRDLMIERMWEYGGRAGVWRLLRILEKYEVPATFFVCAMALENNPPLGPQIVSHGHRWIAQWRLDREAERESIHQAAVTIEKMTGRRPLDWWTKSGPSLNTRELLAAEGFLYDCDAVNDDLPYYDDVNGNPWLVVPYALDTNDGKFWRAGWSNADEFFHYLKDAFDLLYEEGATHAKMMSVGLHSRVSGRPGRAMALARFLEHVRGHPRVWWARRDEIARWWLDRYPPQ